SASSSSPRCELKEIRACAKNPARFPRGRTAELMQDAARRIPDSWHATCDSAAVDALREECAMETLIIADRDVDQAQATMLAVRNAGFDDPIFYVRSGAALLARLSGSAQKAKPPAAIWIGLELLRDCEPELARCLRLAETPIALTAMLSSDRERSQLEQCGF